MTIDLHLRRVADAFLDNDVMRLTRDTRNEGLRLAAAAWLAQRARPKDAHRRAIDEIASLIHANLANYSLWLLACHSTWQPDSRIIRHLGLWGTLKARGILRPFGHEVAKGMVQAPNGLRYFEVVKLELNSLESAEEVLHAEPASHLVALRQQHEPVLSALTRAGWDSAHFGPSPAVLSAVCGSGGAVLWPVGSFDDQEAGAVAIAMPEVLNKLLR